MAGDPQGEDPYALRPDCTDSAPPRFRIKVWVSSPAELGGLSWMGLWLCCGVASCRALNLGGVALVFAILSALPCKEFYVWVLIAELSTGL